MNQYPSVNPFDQDIVTEPRRIEPAVPGLNDRALQALLGEFKQLVQGAPPRIDIRLNHTRSVVSPEAGYGKSHLIGRLFQALDGQATRIYIFPFEDPATCWKSILDHIVYELKAPERNNPQDLLPDEPTQLDASAHGVIAHLIADLVEAGQVATKQPRSEVIQALRAGILGTYHQARGHQRWTAYIRSFFARRESPQRLAACIDRRRVRLFSDSLCWLRLLYSYAWSGDIGLRKPCLDWLRGNSIDEEDAKRIGLSSGDLPKPDPSAGELNELCKNRILDLCQLAGFYRPFVFCFDQTENYGKSSDLARALGECLQVMTDLGPNQMTVFTVNQGPWTSSLKPYWEDAHKDRLAPPLELQAINRSQADDLIHLRCRTWEIPEARVKQFLDGEQVLDTVFKARPAMGIRMLLQECRRKWQAFIEEPPPPEGSLDELFQEYLDKLTSQAHRLEFNRDILRWLIHDAAKGLSGIEVSQVETRPGQRVPCWRRGQQTILFDFESGSHWKRWQAIVQRADAYCQQHPNTKIVYLRTPELDPIPGRWPTVGPRIEEAKRRFLHILVLELDSVKSIYAGYALYSDALQGDIDFKPEEVMAFLRKKLAPLWQSITQAPNAEPRPPPPPEPDKSLASQVRAVVQQARFLSLDELLNKFPRGLSRDAVLAACGLVPEIAIHTSPTMVVLHWQSGSR